MKYFQVIFCRSVLTATIAQSIVSHAEIAGRKEVFAVTIVIKCARLAYQPIDNVVIVHVVLATTAKPRKRVDLFLRVPHLQMIRVNAHVDMFTDQSAMHRIRITQDLNQTAAVHQRSNLTKALQSLAWQTPQHRMFFRQTFLTVCVAAFSDFIEKRSVRSNGFKVATATHHQGLIDCRLEIPVRRFYVAFFIRMAGLCLLHAHFVMPHQALIAGYEFTRIARVVDCRTEPISPMPLRHTAQFP